MRIVQRDRSVKNIRLPAPPTMLPPEFHARKPRIDFVIRSRNFPVLDAFGVRAIGSRRCQKKMSKEDEYRKNAAETVGLASRAATTQDKGRLLAMAEAWLDLANRAHRAASHQSPKVRERRRRMWMAPQSRWREPRDA
jgi:hypothetical protein